MKQRSAGLWSYLASLTLLQGTTSGCLFLLMTLSVTEGDSFVEMGVQGVAQAAPVLLVMLLFRYVGRRASLQTLVVPMLSLQALAAIGVTAVALTVGYSIQMGVIAGAIYGLAASAQGPGWKSLLADLIPSEVFKQRFSQFAAINNTIRLIAPGIAGLTIALNAWWLIFLADVLVCLAAIVVFSRRFAERRKKEREDEEAGTGTGTGEPAECRHNFLRSWPFLVPFALISVFGFNIQLFAPVLATQVFDDAGTLSGMLVSVHGIGAVLGSALVGWCAAHLRSGFGLGALLLGLFIVASPFPGSLVLVVVFLGTAGIARGFVLTAATVIPVTVFTRRRAREQLMSTNTVMIAGSGIVSAPLFAFLLETWSLTSAFVVFGGGCLLAGLVWVVFGRSWWSSAALPCRRCDDTAPTGGGREHEKDGKR